MATWNDIWYEIFPNVIHALPCNIFLVIIVPTGLVICNREQLQINHQIIYFQCNVHVTTVLFSIDAHCLIDVHPYFNKGEMHKSILSDVIAGVEKLQIQ